MKKVYIQPQMKEDGIAGQDLLLGLSAFDKNRDAQDVDPDEEEEYNDEFGSSEAVWYEVDHFIKY